MTVSDAFHRCWAGYWNQPRFQNSRWAKEVQGYFRRRIENHPIAGLQLHEVKPKVVRDWHAEIGQMVSQIEANRAMEVLSRVFTFAEEQEIIPLGSNPCRLVKAFTETKRERYATPNEVRRITNALLRHWNDYPRDVGFLFFVLLTGSRPSALERAKRSDIREGILRVDGKNTAETGEKDVIALPDFVMQQILPRIPRREDGLLFGPGLPQKLWDKVKTAAGCEDLWARDLRRTFATFGFSRGEQHSLVGELLNHRSSQTTMIYAKLLPTARIAAVNRIAEGLVEAMGMKR